MPLYSSAGASVGVCFRGALKSSRIFCRRFLIDRASFRIYLLPLGHAFQQLRHFDHQTRSFPSSIAADDPQQPAATMLPVRALPPPIAEPGGNLYHQHHQQRNRDPDDGIDIRGPGRLDRHGLISVSLAGSRRQPRATGKPQPCTCASLARAA